LVVGGNAAWGSGELYPDDTTKEENAFVGGSFNGASYLEARITANDTTQGGNLDADFESARAYYTSISQNLALEADNVVATIQWSGLFLTCADASATSYAVTVDGDTFAQISWYSVDNCNPSATWVFNVGGTDQVSFVGGSFPGVAEIVLYNILGSGRDIFVESGVIGNILAPNHYYSQIGGNTLGIVIAGDVLTIKSASMPFCSDFQNYGIDTFSSDAIAAGSNSINVVSLNAFNDGDQVTVGDGDTVTISELQIVDGQPVLVVDPAVGGDYPSNTNIHVTVNGNATRTIPNPTIITTPAGSSSENSAVVISAAAFVLLIALFA